MATAARLNVSLDAPIGATLTFDGARILTGAALRGIIAERMKQVDRHGRTLDHDLATHWRHDLPLAAASYLNAAVDQLTGKDDIAAADQMTWPWAPEWWRPEDARANLIKAAALVWAAIDRLDGEAAGEMARIHV